jgi:NADH-quinone oxidoreductase subunit J
MNASTWIFFLLSGLLVVASLMVVFLRNVVHCAMALVAALFVMAIFFVTLQAPMVGVLQVLVYAGAVMVLFLFVIMLLNPATLEPGRSLWWNLGTLLAVFLGGLLATLFLQNHSALDRRAASESFGSPETLAKSLFNDFVLPFEITSILLLVAMVGAVVLAKREP